ncbi:MAG: 50S ribosomal protein L13 [bacterium]
MMKTFSVKAKDIQRKWYVVDAEGKILGRLASRVAQILRGKHKTIFTPHLDTGDHVIVINADKIRVTGKKMEQRMYYSHSGYPGGFKARKMGDIFAKHPERLVFNAIKGMLPHNRLGRKMLTKLRVYSGSTHPHQAQKPEVLEI